MVQMYTIAGRQIGSHVLAMCTLSTIFGVTYLSTRGSKPKVTQSPPINASSSDEEAFIKNFLKNTSAEEKGEKKAA
ncbi:BgTH12-00168 [Blumeria graminis f. sp. triticale]|uniref:Bgt-3732 n=3 Tax=Blumeria graminis TaxID=34373 RepID=A0A381L5F2_BLUGR|nr:hypothetical protein BGT96224_3732 [Blumeria graminis f. sp. tritici 96224]CAD6504662.1 BgTH12-00168 [Blumeria graminis f. sp. triticale]VDB92700.1 Bgt-3732 [Blumeria graminis f. sp. tritici]